MKGGAGERRKGFSVTERTPKGRPASPSARARASGSSRTRTAASARRSPVAEKSRPLAKVTPSRATNEAPKLVRGQPGRRPLPSAVEKVPSTPHQVAERKAMRARSRSTTIRVATLWTRPADSRGITFFHSTGETS